jgi:hypothetical protein
MERLIMKKQLSSFFKAILLCQISMLFFSGCAAPNEVSRIRKGAPVSEEEGFTVRRMFREIFSEETFQNAAHSFFTDELGPAPIQELRSEKVERELKEEFGETNGKALEALMLHDFGKARDYAQLGLESNDSKQKQDAAWILALVALETIPSTQMMPYYKIIVREDRRIKTPDEAREALLRAHEKLVALRDYFSRP